MIGSISKLVVRGSIPPAVSLRLQCHTVGVAFHEGFWVATGTAAPVIALAAVVSLADAGRELFSTWAEVTNFFSRLGSSTISRAVLLAALGIFNVFLQAALLAVSLVSLADGANSVPDWLAIAAAVGGVMLLAGSSLGIAGLRVMAQRGAKRRQEAAEKAEEEEKKWQQAANSDGPE